MSAEEYWKSLMMDLFKYKVTRVKSKLKNNHNYWKSNIIKELLQRREGSMYCEMSAHEVNDISFHLFTA